MCALRVTAERLQIGLVLAALRCLPGCANWPFYAGPDLRRGTQQATQLDLTYRLDAARMNLPVAVARVEGQLVSYDEVAGSLDANRTAGSLHIVSPSPAAAPGFARAEVRIDAAPLPKLPRLDTATSGGTRWSRLFSKASDAAQDAWHETWAMDVPQAQIDELTAGLSSPGRMKQADRRHPAGADLTTDFNGRHYHAACQSVPELDALMRKVRDHGQLVSYSHPLTAQSKQLHEASSMAMFRDDPSQVMDGGIDPNHSPAVQMAQTSGLAAPNASRVVYWPTGSDPIARR